MKEFNEKIDILLKQATQIDVIEIEDIPNIDLYMDQVTTFMENKLKNLKRIPDDKILTKTMINNYAKAKLFPPPIKKKYTNNHIMLLIIIYHLKTILSINDINKLLKPITDELKVSEKSELLEIVYRSFVILQKSNTPKLEDISDVINQTCEVSSFKNGDQIKLILTILLLCIQANTHKRLAERILDEFF